MSTNYLALLKGKSEKNIPIDRTDKTDKSTLVSFVSCPYEEKKSLFPNSRQEIEKSWCWRVEFPDRPALTVSYSPEVSREEVLADYPAAIRVVPVDSIPVAVESASLNPEDETRIRVWLESIGETGPAIVAETLELCQRDSGARGYFLGRAKPGPFDREAFEERAGICEHGGGLSREEAEAAAWREDDRRRCAHCLNLLPNGICKAAAPGGPVHARRGYQPNPDWLHRCLEYRPCLDDPDRRMGRERWPGRGPKRDNALRRGT
jgi:hypothetical protein